MDVSVANYFKRVEKIISRGGPEPSEYDYVVNVPNLEGITLEEESKIHDVLFPILDKDSLLGHTFYKPHGYAGDFELIDRLYTKWLSPDPSHHKWDNLYHTLDAATAVRNRKNYFQDVMKNYKNNDELKVLNLGSGPCRDLYEFFVKNPKQNIQVDCLDMDQSAIDYGSAVCDNYMDRIEFINKNVFKYKTSKTYDLIWSAGLFDYFSDKLFIRLVNRMYALVASNGELVIGNFSTVNTSKNLMETFGQWYLNHRSEDLLIELALKAGVPEDKIMIKEEPTGVNFFLHLEK